MISTKQKIRICDDTGFGDIFYVNEILYSDTKIIVCNVVNDFYIGSFPVMIYRENKEVVCNELRFYYAENYE
jgi:hypothetical protein